MAEGLIHALLLDGQGGARFLDWQQIDSWGPAQGELWLHLDYSAYAVKDWLINDSEIALAVVDTLLNSESRPRFSQLDSGTLMAWRGANLNPSSDPEDMVAVRLWYDENRLISTLHRDLRSVEVIRAQFEKGKGPNCLSELLVALADSMVWKIGECVEDFEEQMGMLEDQVIDRGSAGLRSELSALRRQVIAMRRYLAPQKEALMRFSMEKLSWLNQSERIELREVVDRITRELEDLEALRDRAVVAQEELQNHLSEQLNNRMYLLSIITAVFLPLGFLTGLMGINVGGIPGSENPMAFRYFVWSVIILIIVQLILFKWRKWF